MKEDRQMERKMRMLSRFLGLLAVIVVAMLCGCSTIDISDIGAYDRYYTDSASRLTATPSPKFVFYVPYEKFNIARNATGDTTPVLDALKAVYGEDIAFEKSSSAPYVVSVKSVEEWKEEVLTAKVKIVAEFKFQGGTKELVAEYSRTGDWGLGLDRVYSLYRAAALDLAKQIKNLTDAQH